ncbi:MAG: hypothetical protein Q4G45_07445 [Actinomycetia bacterium]|nr:hypothetical protein [Actinomycetes bacterium]
MVISSRVAGQINAAYFDNFACEYQCGTFRNLLYLESEQAPHDTWLDYRSVVSGLQREQILDKVRTATGEELLELSQGVAGFRALTEGLRPPPAAGSRLMLAHRQPALVTGPPDVALFGRLRSGRKNAEKYERLIEHCLGFAFPMTLADPHWQHAVDDGRKIIDITYANVATQGGLMAFARSAYGASKVVVECKNYTDDPANPEVDQLAGRMRPEFGKFGLLVCRRVKNMELLLRRCQDAHKNQGLLLVPLVDEDVISLVESVDHRRTLDAGYVSVGDTGSVLASRMWRVHTGLGGDGTG